LREDKNFQLTISSTPQVPCPEQPLGQAAKAVPIESKGKIKNVLMILKCTKEYILIFIYGAKIFEREGPN
jgi:hypothetical protein